MREKRTPMAIKGEDTPVSDRTATGEAALPEDQGICETAQLTASTARERASTFALSLDKAVARKKETGDMIAVEKQEIDAKHRWLNGVFVLSPGEIQKTKRQIRNAEARIAGFQREEEALDAEMVATLRERRRELEMEEMMQTEEMEAKQKRLEQVREEIRAINRHEGMGWR